MGVSEYDPDGTRLVNAHERLTVNDPAFRGLSRQGRDVEDTFSERDASRETEAIVQLVLTARQERLGVDVESLVAHEKRAAVELASGEVVRGRGRENVDFRGGEIEIAVLQVCNEGTDRPAGHFPFHALAKVEIGVGCQADLAEHGPVPHPAITARQEHRSGLVETRLSLESDEDALCWIAV